jgi:hypothetical protein
MPEAGCQSTESIRAMGEEGEAMKRREIIFAPLSSPFYFQILNFYPLTSVI